MTPFEYIKKHVNVKIQPSIINGVGLFALRDIEEGEDLFVEWKNETGKYYLSNSEFNSLDYTIRNHLMEMYGFENIDGEYLFFFFLNKDCHWIFKTPLHWMNSCGWEDEPNFDSKTLKAKRKIKKGEELLTKYGKYNKFKRTRTI